MATPDNNPPIDTHAKPRVEVAHVRETTVSTEVGSKTAITRPSSAVSVEIGDEDLHTEEQRVLNEEPGKPGPTPGAKAAESEAATLAEGEAEPLAAYDPANEEVRKSYDTRYFKPSEDGLSTVLNVKTLGEEFWANAEKDPEKPGLNPDTYKYLKDTLGIDEADVRKIEKSMRAEASVINEAFFKRVGGKERYEAALKWGRDGGYTQEQRDHFNEVRKQGGAALDDAVDALMARYGRATGNVEQGRRGPPPVRRPSTPERNVTGANAPASPSGVKPFANYLEYQTAIRTANKANKGKPDLDQVAEVRKRLRASAWHKG